MQCSRKAVFTSQEKADRARARHGTTDPNVVSYRCDDCGHWHNGRLDLTRPATREERYERWRRQTDTAMGNALRALGHEDPLGLQGA